MKNNFLKTTLAAGMLMCAGLAMQAQVTPCQTATSLSCNTIYSGTTTGGWPTPPSPGGGITAPSVWYTYVGTGQVVRATVTASYDARVTVQRPSGGNTTCNSWNMIGTNDNGVASSSTDRNAEVAWFAASGVTYYVIVHGTSGQNGSYNLNFRCDGTSAPSNDNCANAKRIYNCITDVNLTTYNATNENFLHPVNGLTNSNRGVWFRVGGISGDRTLSTCGQTWFDDRLFVWEVSPGSGCASITSVAPNWDNDDQCLTQAQITFTANASREYLILLDGYSSSHRGNYDLTICDPVMKTSSPAAASTTVTASPNPANTQVRFDFAVKQDGVVKIGLFNLAGQQVASISSGALEAGMSASSDLDVSSLPSGMYLYRAEIDGQLQSGKIQIAH